jgi:curved DNA-binding protein CbpA
MSQQADPYRVLGVKRDASLEEIKRAFNSLALSLHPDTAANITEESGNKSSIGGKTSYAHDVGSSNAERFAKVKEAFDILRDKNRRATYDRGYMHRGGRYGSEEGYGYGGYSGADLRRRAAEFQRMQQQSQSFQQNFKGEFPGSTTSGGTWKSNHSRAMLSLETLFHPKSIALALVIPLIAWSLSALIVKEVAPSLSEYEKFQRRDKDKSTTINRFDMPSWVNSSDSEIIEVQQQSSLPEETSNISEKKATKRILLQ